MTFKRNLFLAGAIVVGSAGFAQAEMVATAINDLNVRAGPGPQYPAVGVAPRGSQAMLDGCIQEAAGAGLTSAVSAAGSMRSICKSSRLAARSSSSNISRNLAFLS